MHHRLNPDWVREISATANQSPFFQLQSMTITSLTPGQATLNIDLDAKHLQPFGKVHGGVFSTLIDAAGWWAVYTELPEGLGMTTLEMKLNYLAPISEGRMIGKGQSIKLGKSVGLGQASIETEEGRILAHGTVTIMVVPNLKIEGQDRLPTKFLE